MEKEEGPGRLMYELAVLRRVGGSWVGERGLTPEGQVGDEDLASPLGRGNPKCWIGRDEDGAVPRPCNQDPKTSIPPAEGALANFEGSGKR